MYVRDANQYIIFIFDYIAKLSAKKISVML